MLVLYCRRCMVTARSYVALVIICATLGRSVLAWPTSCEHQATDDECCCMSCGGGLVGTGGMIFNWTTKLACAASGGQCKPNTTSAYNRPAPSKRAMLTVTSDPVQQVHLIGGSPNKVTIVYTTQAYSASSITYGNISGHIHNATGTSKTYSVMLMPSGRDFIDDHTPTPGHAKAYCGPAAYQKPECFYTSPFIHTVTLSDLKPSTIYEYQPFSSLQTRSFRTPPAVGQPISFGVLADVGRTRDAQATMQHISNNIAAGQLDTVLLVGDLSYADGYAPAWDEYGRLSEFLHDRVPTAYASGNHEVANGMENFANFLPRYGWPGSTYWFDFEAGLAHVITLCSYCDYSPGSPQYMWVQSRLASVDRTRTPWLIVATHVPFYSSNAHHSSSESDAMKTALESMFYQHKVDLILSGHVHAYERTGPIYQYREVCDAPIQLVIGDAGNKEGPACPWNATPSTWSKFREFSFGHAVLSLVNATHARWEWHRNQDAVAVEADGTWLQTASTRCEPVRTTHSDLIV